MLRKTQIVAGLFLMAFIIGSTPSGAGPLRTFAIENSFDSSLSIPATSAGSHLRSWLKAHNSADPDSLKQWILASFGTETLTELDLGNHVAFYLESVSMFGAIHETPYRIIKSEEHALIVHFIEEAHLLDKVIDPANVVTVEVDTDPETGYLQRGLGLASLVCALKTHRTNLLPQDSTKNGLD